MLAGFLSRYKWGCQGGPILSIPQGSGLTSSLGVTSYPPLLPRNAQDSPRQAARDLSRWGSCLPLLPLGPYPKRPAFQLPRKVLTSACPGGVCVAHRQDLLGSRGCAVPPICVRRCAPIHKLVPTDAHRRHMPSSSGGDSNTGHPSWHPQLGGETPRHFHHNNLLGL